MSTIELSSPYTTDEEYVDMISAYSLKEEVGLKHEEDFFTENKYLLVINYPITEADTFSKYQSMFDIFTGMIEPINVNPTPITDEYNGAGNMEKNEKTVDELFKEAYDECEATDINELSIKDYIQYCEELYNMKTNEFLEWFAKKGYEGNVDMQLWATYAQNERDKGVER